MKTLFFRTIFAFVIVLFFLPTLTKACFCSGGGPACQDVGNTFSVFAGKVVSITNIPRQSTQNEKRTSNFFNKKVSFSVSKPLKGASENKVEILTSSSNGSCGYRFEIGKEYVVYANKNEETGELTTSTCSRTRLIEDAGEDFQYFNDLSANKYKANIYGQVFRVFTRKQNEPYREPEPMPNIKLTLSNGKKITTNEKGEYRFDKLLSQEYTITPMVPQGLRGGDKPERKVKLNPNGCSLVNFVFLTNTSLSGQVLDENSQPLAETSVQLVPIDQINNRSQSDMKMAHTDKDGYYIFHSIPNGDYYLGVRLFRIADLLFPYPRSFYPNTVNLAEAKIISIKEGDILKSYDIRLGQKLSQRKVSGIVVYPDGTPVINATVIVQETEYFEGSSSRAFESESDGTFKITLVNGLRHIVRAFVSNKETRQQSHSEPVEIPANGEINDLKLIITQPNVRSPK